MMTHATISCQVCERRGDEQAEIIRVHLEGAGADLHATDARYHITRYQTFTSERNIKATTRRSATSNTLASEVAVEAAVSTVRVDTDRVWSFVELYTLYKEKEGVDCNRSRLVNSLKEIIGDDWVTSTYHDVRRFKISSAISNTESSRLTGFDAQMHTQNGLKQTNRMATIITQPTQTFSS